mgnify:CR=1 FL=1
MNVAAKLQGCKTYLAVAGLIGLAIYQASTGEYQAAIQTAMAAAAAAGLRNAITTASTPKP